MARLALGLPDSLLLILLLSTFCSLAMEVRASMVFRHLDVVVDIEQLHLVLVVEAYRLSIKIFPRSTQATPCPDAPSSRRIRVAGNQGSNQGFILGLVTRLFTNECPVQRLADRRTSSFSMKTTSLCDCYGAMLVSCR